MNLTNNPGLDAWVESAGLLRALADGFDVVAIEVAEEHAVVGRVVLRPQARCVEDLNSCGFGCCAHGVNGCAVLGRERDVRFVTRFGGGARADPEVGVLRSVGIGEADNEAVWGFVAHGLDESNRCKHREEECGRCRDVSDLDSYVIEHTLDYRLPTGAAGEIGGAILR